MAPTQGGRYRGSVKDSPDFDANHDAEKLYKAMKGIGSDKEAILDLITSRSNRQRQEVTQAYKSAYGKDLLDDLKYELTGKFERLIVGLMRPLAYFDAKEIKDSLAGIGTDEKCLIEILASRTNQQMHALVAAYKDAYDRDLETDVVGDTTGHFKKMLVVLLQGEREEDDVVSEDLVEQDAKITPSETQVRWQSVKRKQRRKMRQCVSQQLLYQHVKEMSNDLFEAGEQKWGTDEAQFIYILGNRSTQHLQLVFDEYKNLAGKEIEDSIKGELSGDFRKLMLSVVKCMRSTKEYFAKRLYKSMKGMGTADNTLIRIMVSRSELDMMDIREAFRTKYEKSLYSMIKNDTSGEYKKALLKLCGGDDDAAGEFFPEAAQVAYQRWELSAVARVELKGTVQPAADFVADNDAKVLRKAMKGLGTDEGSIINIVTQRSNAQRQEILKAFKKHFGRDVKTVNWGVTRSRAFVANQPASHNPLTVSAPVACAQHYQDLASEDLMADLKSELSGTLSKAVLGLMMTPAQFDAKQLKKAMEGAGTDEKALIEILATRNNQEIQAINEAYQEAFKKSLEDSLTSDTSGHFRRILVSLALGNRDEGGEDFEKAVEDAKVLADVLEISDAAGDGDSSSMETRFMSILCTRSYPHLRRGPWDLKDAYIPMLPSHQRYRRFVVRTDHYQFQVLPFALKSTPCTFTKCMVRLLQIFDDRASRVIKVCVSMLQRLGLLINYKQSFLEHSQTIFSWAQSLIRCKKSLPVAVFQEFIKQTNHDVEHTIKKEMSGDVKDAFVAIVKSVRNKPAFFAERLYKAMKGAGTDEKTLIRILITRSEIDLLNIRQEFKEAHEKSLHHCIESETSGDFRKTLITLCGGDD